MAPQLRKTVKNASRLNRKVSKKIQLNHEGHEEYEGKNEFRDRFERPCLNPMNILFLLHELHALHG